MRGSVKRLDPGDMVTWERAGVVNVGRLLALRNLRSRAGSYLCAEVQLKGFTGHGRVVQVKFEKLKRFKEVPNESRQHNAICLHCQEPDAEEGSRPLAASRR